MATKLRIRDTWVDVRDWQLNTLKLTEIEAPTWCRCRVFCECPPCWEVELPNLGLYKVLRAGTDLTSYVEVTSMTLKVCKPDGNMALPYALYEEGEDLICEIGR